MEQRMEAQNMGLERVSTNLGKCLFDEVTLPDNEVESYLAALDIIEDLGTPDKMIIRNDAEGSEFAILYNDVEGDKVFAPLIGFSLESGSQGHSMLMSLLDVLGADDDEDAMTEDSLGEGVWHLDFETGSLVQTKNLAGESLFSIFAEDNEDDFYGEEEDFSELEELGDLADEDVDAEVERLEAGQDWMATAESNVEDDEEGDDFVHRVGDVAHILGVEEDEVIVAFTEYSGDETYSINLEEFVRRFALCEGEEAIDGLETEVMKTVIRGGKKVKKKVRKGKPKRRSAKQKAALKKAQKKSGTAGAKKERAKSMKKRQSMGMESWEADDVKGAVEDLLQTDGIDELRDVVEVMVKKIRGGKVVKVKKKLGRKRRMSAKQKAALKKARKKAGSASAKKKRAKSMKIRKRKGL